jgi:ribosomal protein S18 acetylase RimI-like enzyme
LEIFEVTKYSEKTLEALNILLPQLSPSALLLSSDDLLKIIQSESSHLLLAEKDDRYYGTLTLVMYTIPTDTKARIEDVVVGEDARGRGIGRMLLERAVILAKELGANTVDLTSKPSREAANALYKKVGFKPRKTNVYRYTL